MNIFKSLHNMINTNVSTKFSLIVILLFFMYLLLNHLIIKPFNLSKLIKITEGMEKCTPSEEKRMNNLMAKSKVLNDKYNKIKKKIKNIKKDSDNLLFDLKHTM